MPGLLNFCLKEQNCKKQTNKKNHKQIKEEKIKRREGKKGVLYVQSLKHTARALHCLSPRADIKPAQPNRHNTNISNANKIHQNYGSFKSRGKVVYLGR